MNGVPGAAACTRHSMASTSQLPNTVVEIRLPGAVAPISGIGMTATGMSNGCCLSAPNSAR